MPVQVEYSCPRCGEISTERFCPDHRTSRRASRTGQRGGSTRAWRKLRDAVLQRDGHTCQVRLPCCTKAATTVDHRIAAIDGGEDLMDNLRAACGPCNYSRNNNVKAKTPSTAPSRKTTARIPYMA